MRIHEVSGTLPRRVIVTRGPAGQTRRAGSPTKVLIVDDHEDSRIIARLVLEQAGCEVSEAANGSDGLHLALADPPDIILVDIVMPLMDGWELTRRLRAHEATAGVRIIAVTALVEPDTHERSMAAGCDGLLTKPVHIATLVSAMCVQVAARVRLAL